MKTFDKIERKLIKTIAEDERMGGNIISLLDDYLDKTHIIINIKERKITLNLDIQNKKPTPKEEEWCIKKLKQLQYQIIVALNLINYLEKNGFITTYKPTNVLQNIIPFGKGLNIYSIPYSFPDSKTNDLLIKYVKNEIIASPDLKVFVSNKYQTKYDLRFIRQMRVAWTGIIISFAIGLFSICNSRQSRIKNDKQITKINSLLDQQIAAQSNMLNNLKSINSETEHILINTTKITVATKKQK